MGNGPIMGIVKEAKEEYGYSCRILVVDSPPPGFMWPQVSC